MPRLLGLAKPPRGRLIVYVAAASGAGKTVRMLEDARARAGQGDRVLVTELEDHGRPYTRRALHESGLPSAPLLRVVGQAGVYWRLGFDAVLVDHIHGDLVPGLPRADAFQRVRQAGLDVVVGFNAYHLASASRAVERLLGHPIDVVPDAVFDGARFVLVDATIATLRERSAAGDLFPGTAPPAHLDGVYADEALAEFRNLAIALAERGQWS